MWLFRDGSGSASAMMDDGEIEIDWLREERTGVAEAVFCAPKSDAQIEAVLRRARQVHHRLLLTRLAPERFVRLSQDVRVGLDYDRVSRTAIFGGVPAADEAKVALVAAGTSDLPVVVEAARTLAFYGLGFERFVDVGVAGLDRLLRHIERLRGFDVILAFAGMEGALFTILGGLVHAAVIAVPTSVGMGVAQGGRVALNAALATCAPGVVVVNVDNGFGAACAAVKILRPAERRPAGLALHGAAH